MNEIRCNPTKSNHVIVPSRQAVKCVIISFSLFSFNFIILEPLLLFRYFLNNLIFFEITR